MPLNLEEYFCPIPGAKNEKEIVIFSRKHWVSFLGHILLSIVIIIMPIIIFIFIKLSHVNLVHGAATNLIVIIISIYYLIVLTFIFTGWVTFYYDIYILTVDEIIDITQQGLWGRKIARLSLLRVQDVNSHIKGFLPTLFAYGDVLIETAGETENFLLKSLPNPQAFAAKVLELHSKLIENANRESQIASAEGDLAKPLPPSAPKVTPLTMPNKKPNGEISKDDLKSGGEIKF